MKKVCVGIILGAQGIRGQLKIKSFTTNPIDLTAYGTLSNEDGTQNFLLRINAMMKDKMIASCEGISDRTMAENLKGMRLYVARDAMPMPKEDEFYHVDLLGLSVMDEAGTPLGAVKAVSNYGGGDFLEVTPPKGAAILTIPFTKEAVPTVNLAKKQLIALRSFVLSSEEREDA